MNEKYVKHSDADLVDLTRRGDQAAFGELWRRHASAGRAAARAITSSFDPDDLVSEAYIRILGVIQNGGGPQSSFRAYLLRTVHNLAVKWARGSRTQSLGNGDELEDPDTTDDAVERDLDRGLTADAFRALPARWKEVLWYVEVEEMTASEIAPLLGLRPNAVAALTYRAREGLRQAWIQAHLRAEDLAPEHRWAVERLGAYTRGGLRKRELQKVQAHLDDCTICQSIAVEAETAGSQLSLTLVPIAIGLAGAASYLEWVRGGSIPTTVQAMGSEIDVASNRKRPHNHPRRVFLWLILLGIAATIAVILMGSQDRPESADLHEPDTSMTTPTAPEPPTPSLSPTPPVTEIEDAVPTMPAAPESPQDPARIRNDELGPPSAPPSNPASTGTLSPHSPPLISAINTGTGTDTGRWFPIVSGTAAPGATVTIAGGGGESVVIANADGTWTTPQLTNFDAGEHRVSVTQRLGSLPRSVATTREFQMLPPPSIDADGGRTQFSVLVEGDPQSSVQVLADGLIGWGTPILSETGTWDTSFRWFTSAGSHDIAVRYGNSDRWGPSASEQITISR